MSAAIMQLAVALERGDVTRLHVTTARPDQLVDDLVEAGAQLEHAVTEKTELDRGGRLRWRQGSVLIGKTPVLVTSEMQPVVRSPYTDGISLAPVADVAHELAAELGGEG